MTKTSVVILNYNGRDYLKKFLPPLLLHSHDCEIVVVDNASTDDSITILKEGFPQVKILRIEENLGFAGGYQYALKQIETEYYVLLNSDVEVTAGWLTPLIAFLDQHPDYAACQPKILSYDHKEAFEYAGAAGGFLDKLGYPFCRGRIFDEIELDDGQYDDPTDIFWASGACMIIRADTYHEVGGLDPDFFAHMEEIDLCWRLHSHNYKIGYIADSRVYHVGGGTLSRSNPRKTYYNFRNGLFLLYKNLEAKELLWKIPIRLVLDGMAAFKLWYDQSFKDFQAVIRAHMAFYGSIRKLNHKRRKIPKKSTNDIDTIKGWLVFDFYLKNRKRFSDYNRG